MILQLNSFLFSVKCRVGISSIKTTGLLHKPWMELIKPIQYEHLSQNEEDSNYTDTVTNKIFNIMYLNP